MVVRTARGADEVDRALELRRRVFSVEQGVSERADRDGRDDEAIHLIALDDGALLGTCRVLVRGRVAALGRLAVAADDRLRGIGGAVLAGAEGAARDAGAARVTLHAQLEAEGFYTRNGYVRRGAAFVEQGIAHVSMEKPIA